MFLVGLTGGIATGKSTVSQMVRSSGQEVIDADLIAREVVEPGKVAWKRIRQHFGDAILTEPNGAIDRAALGFLIFGNETQRKLLNNIVHPEVYREILKRCLGSLLKGRQMVFLDLPLLFESGYMLPFIHKIIVVSCREDQQLHRLMQRNNFTEREAEARIRSQMSLSEKCSRADYIIDNSQDEEETRRQVEATLSVLQASKAHWKVRAVIAVFLLLLLFLTYRFLCWINIL